MNIFRPQVPYVFHPPRYSPWLAPLLKRFSGTFMLSRKFKTRVVSVEGLERVAALNRAGHALLVAPNHADHADPHVLVYAAGTGKLSLHFMAAREGFEKGRLSAFALQRMGAFSVDREGADVSAIKTAMHILQQGVFPLVIFPEGEIYHHHETLDELNEGVATILLRATAKLKDGQGAFIVPTALRYVHDPAVASTFAGRVSRLEQRVTWKPRPHVDIVERIYRLGGGLLALKEQEFLGRTTDAPLGDRIFNLQNALVEQLEEKHGRGSKSDRIPDRVKALRGKIRKALLEEVESQNEQTRWSRYDDLDRLFVAVQLYSYPGQYLAAEPSVDRIAETLLKLEEDVLGEGDYPASREAHVRFDEPIDVNSFMAERALDTKSGVGPLTQHVAMRIQSMLADVAPG